MSTKAGLPTTGTNGLEFNEKDHTYTYNGAGVPSVTTLIGIMHPDVYKGIPKRILERKAAYGDRVHELVENAAMGIIPGMWTEMSFERLAFNRYMELQEEHQIKVASCEQLVCYVEDGMPIYAGKYDMLGTVEGKRAIIDIKTTAKLHTDMLSEQLPLYAWAIENMTHGLEIEKAYCLWLPKKDRGELIEINIPDKKPLMERVMKAYESYWSR